MTVYLDTSVIVPIHVDEPSSATISDVIGGLPDLPTLSDYGAGEFCSAISRYVRMEVFTPSQGATVIDRFDGWTLTSAHLLNVGTPDVARASRIVRNFDLKLRFPDALHLAICANHSIRLATRDQQMAAAALALGLDVLQLD